MQAGVCATNKTVFGRLFKNNFTVLAEETNQECSLFLAFKLALAKIGGIGAGKLLVGNDLCSVRFTYPCGKSLAAQAFHTGTTRKHNVGLTLNVR